MSEVPFANRHTAGQALADRLKARAGQDNILVLALPRGGVPVAAVVAHALGAPLDVMVVRKLGMPGHEEFAMGAIASGGVTVLDDSLLQRLRLEEDSLQAVIDKENRELARRELAYRGERPYPDLHGKEVVLVDDGIATGSSMRAAIQAVRQLGAEHCTLAVPVAPSETLEDLSSDVDDIVCVATPEPFRAVGQWYVEFGQTSDDEVSACLSESALRSGSST
ncbi:phosphoribosyltransferase [Halomonas sp. McH1-25]|uniref:phosphoribosyltransferase n=1 Tax=unclassified Halomonas TaxID=2609666 RepID=UPI001EF57EF6|nr:MULTISPECIES: phosphoribosyltransferase [unclassified Halomonas]MCG7600257.1 phosphoribosyltransferase [Halomonas sp. McH1-25]MCP1343427.1 phosphoribosyltransferase [Halomonas sp. FL8]MCP1359630.1 phosphoribosyltransferase [Halomonas sp. BBD45]